MTPITLFEAWLGCSIAEYLTTLDFNDKIDAIENEFEWLEVYVDVPDERRCEVGDYDVSNDKNIKELKSNVDDLIMSMQTALESNMQETINNYDTYEDVFTNHFGYEEQKMHLGLAICQYSDTIGDLTENHFLSAKNDKKVFETLFLSILK